MKILIMDAFSTIHVGNGALLENTIKLCEEAWGTCEFYIITMDKETNKQKYNEACLYYPMFGGFWFGRERVGKLIWAARQGAFMLLHILNENTFKISSRKLTFSNNQKNAMKAIEKADVCISSSGEMISDTFYQMLPFWLFTYWLAIKKEKPFILFPQSVGPLKMGWTRTLVKMALKNAAFLVGRDKPSHEALLSLGFERDKVMFSPDVAIQQEIGEADIHAYFADRSKKVVGITISSPPRREMGEPVDFIIEIGKQIEKFEPEKYKILIMPSNYLRDGISADYLLCQQLKERLEARFETAILHNRPYFPEEYSALLSQLEFLISTRMHVAILATSIGTPTIAVNTQHKIRAYMTNINMDQFCVEYSDISCIGSLIQEIENERQSLVERLRFANEDLKKEHQFFVNRLRQLGRVSD